MLFLAKYKNHSKVKYIRYIYVIPTPENNGLRISFLKVRIWSEKSISTNQTIRACQL